jgi:protein-S-isoprenylcysteine O-methyltransferase Ste14
MWASARVAPSLPFDFVGRRLAAPALVLLGGAIGLAGTRSFRMARTTVNPLQPDRASALVTTGIYRYTRNPMYVAVALALLGWSVYLGHALAPLGAVAFVAWMDRRQIPAEERALRGLFGAGFERYCSEVRRWL